MKFKITIKSTGALDSGFIDPTFLQDYSDFDDVAETGTAEQFLAKAKGYARHLAMGTSFSSLCTPLDMFKSQEGGSALNAPTKVVYELELDDNFIGNLDDVANAVARQLTTRFNLVLDVWNPSTKIRSDGVTVMPIGYQAKGVEVPALFDSVEKAKKAITVVVAN